MLRYKKIAVTLPTDTYEALERARGKLAKSRSEVVALAIKEWLHGLEAGAASRRYVAGYLRTPESASPADRELARVATADWSEWKPGAPSRAAEPRGSRTRKR